MSFCVLGGIVVGVWAMLSIVGNEHVRRVRELERRYALPPIPKPQVEEVFAAGEDASHAKAA